MKLASYLADGRAAFGVVAGDGVITMNGLLSGCAASLKEALWDKRSWLARVPGSAARKPGYNFFKGVI